MQYIIPERQFAMPFKFAIIVLRERFALITFCFYEYPFCNTYYIELLIDVGFLYTCTHTHQIIGISFFGLRPDKLFARHVLEACELYNTRINFVVYLLLSFLVILFSFMFLNIMYKSYLPEKIYFI